ncbi:MAG: histidine kinase [Pelobium sp.]
MDINPEIALKDSIASNILLGLFCWLIANNLSFYQPKENRFIYIIIWCIVLAGIFVTIIKFTFPAFDYSDLDYLKIFLKSLAIRYIFGFLLIGCMASISILWYSQQEKEVLEQRRNEADKLTKEAELSSLREKLQPHFLFNSLNSISALTVSKPLEARKMVHQLSDFLRGTLRKEDVLSSLKLELEHLQLYLEIEKVRFGNRLNTEIQADEMVLEKKIPPMLLQPLVENAIKFGLYDTLETVTISIKAEFIKPYLQIEIINPFDAATAHPNKGTGFGLSSIQRRLNLLYNRSDLLITKSTTDQFITIIQIPQTHD